METRNPTIRSIEAALVDLPTIRAHKLAMTTMRRQTLVIVQITSDDGATGIGEATTIGGLAYGEQSPEGIKSAIDTYIAPLLVGQDATQIGCAMQRLAAAVQGNSFAKSAIETALLDAQGQRLGVPVHELLGGAVRDALPVLWTLASGDAAVGTYIISRIDHNTITVQLVGHEVEGEPLPATEPVRVVRVAVEEAAEQAEATSGGAQ